MLIDIYFIDDNIISNKGMKYLSEGLKFNSTLKTLNLSNSQLNYMNFN